MCKTKKNDNNCQDYGSSENPPSCSQPVKFNKKGKCSQVWQDGNGKKSGKLTGSPEGFQKSIELLTRIEKEEEGKNGDNR